MNVTTRDLFNLFNPARQYKTFLKMYGLVDGIAEREEEGYEEARNAKQQGTLAGEQVQHDRSNDEVDCG